MDWSGFVSNSSARIVPNSAFASQSHKSRSDFWVGDSGASCHMTNDASKMYCMRPPHCEIGSVGFTLTVLNFDKAPSSVVAKNSMIWIVDDFMEGITRDGDKNCTTDMLLDFAPSTTLLLYIGRI